MNDLHTKEWYKNYADENGYKLGKIFDKMYDAVNKCDGYCPCKYAIYQKNKPDELEDIKCPCIFIQEDMEKTGHCHCKMFDKGEK
nr:MAG TPA: ferredoxin-thioredoxin reductase [Caudoviricetes sp.]